MADPIDIGGGVVLRDLQIGDAGWIIQRHAEHYAAEEGFDASFEALVARILADYIYLHDPVRDRAFVAVRDGQRVGSVFCVGIGPTDAKLRLFLLDPDQRGTGLGRRMLAECLAHARAKGFTRMELWTHESHRAACALYRAVGFTCRSSVPVHTFGCDLVEQQWDIAL